MSSKSEEDNLGSVDGNIDIESEINVARFWKMLETEAKPEDRSKPRDNARSDESQIFAGSASTEFNKSNDDDDKDDNDANNDAGREDNVKPMTCSERRKSYQAGKQYSVSFDVHETLKLIENGEVSKPTLDETSLDVLRKILEIYFDHPCNQCHSDKVTCVEKSVWTCGECHYVWGFDDHTDVSKLVNVRELVQKVMPIRPCIACNNSDIYEICYIYVNGEQLFVCKVCGSEYDLKKSLLTPDASVESQTVKKSEGALTPKKSWADDPIVKENVEKLKTDVGGAAKNVFTGCVDIIKDAISTNTNRKDELVELGAREASGVCPRIGFYLGTLVGLMLFKHPTAGYVGGVIGELVGEALASLIGILKNKLKQVMA